MKPYKGRRKRTKEIAFNLFVTLAFLFALVLIALQFNNPAAAGPERIDFSDYPILAMEPYIPDDADVTMIAKTMYGESQGIWSLTEQAAVAWTICNRVDSSGYGMGKSIAHVVTFPDQFHGYSPNRPVYDDYGRDLRILAADVLVRWAMERDGYDVMRVLPKECLWFSGDGKQNIFRDQYKGGNRWGWELPTPYEN